MEGSGSGSGAGSGFNKPPTAPRSSRRRTRDDNPNEENPEMFVQANLQQPQQVEAGGQMEPADQRARLANRRYSEAFRHRRQTHVQQLEAQVATMEAQNAQANIDYERQMAERTENQTEIEVLMTRREAAAANVRAKEAETERIKEKIERLERKMEAADQKIENIMINGPFYHFFEDTFTTLIDALTPPSPDNPPPPPPPHNPAPGDDEAGPSGVNDSSDDSM